MFFIESTLYILSLSFQVTGEAVYTNDMTTFKDELQASFVLTTIARGKIDKIDTSEALVGFAWSQL